MFTFLSSFKMIPVKHSRYVHDTLVDENSRLSHGISAAEQQIKDLSVALQRQHISVMPKIAVNEDLIRTSTNAVRGFNKQPCFAVACQVQLSAPALTLCEGMNYLAAGQADGAISLWTVTHNNRNSSGGIFRFSSEGVSHTRGPLKQEVEPLVGHKGSVTSLAWLEGLDITSVSLDGTLKCWHIDRPSEPDSFNLSIPAVSHTSCESSLVAAACTKELANVDLRDPNPTMIPMDSCITAVENTNLGLLLGTTTGEVLLFDMRTCRSFQTLQASPAKQPISRISGVMSTTVTCFDGYVRLIGGELPLFVEKEYAKAPISGSMIGSCTVPFATKDEFIVSGSTASKAIVWTSSDSIITLPHHGHIVYDCEKLESFVGSFVTSDSAKNLTMWARSFDQKPSPVCV